MDAKDLPGLALMALGFLIGGYSLAYIVLGGGCP